MERTGVASQCHVIEMMEKKEDNITEPCILCRDERASVASGKYCISCYKELLNTQILGKHE